MSGQAGEAVPRPVFAIFEGGGAKGIAHLGAAEAAVAEGLEFIGVGGTSAGAFVAALLAAGYRGTEFFNPQARGSDLLAQRNEGPTDLLGTAEWVSFQRALAGYKRLLGCALLGGWIGAWLGSRRTLNVVRALMRNKGHFDTGRVQEFVNDSLRARLVELFAAEGLPAADVPARIRFGDLDYRRFKQLRPLKIVATDVQSRKAVLFSQDDTPAAEVAEAVAASIAIPLVFRPVTMQSHPGGPYADGGLTYNLRRRSSRMSAASGPTRRYRSSRSRLAISHRSLARRPRAPMRRCRTTSRRPSARPYLAARRSAGGRWPT